MTKSRALTVSRTVVVTGATSGIGRALALEFGARGDRVVALGRSTRALQSLRKEILARGGECTIHRIDLRSSQSVRGVFRIIRSGPQRVDVLINNAGVTVFKAFGKTSIQEFDAVLETNLRGIFLATHQVLPQMLRYRRGMIVNILSFATKTVYTASSVYAASKAGAEAMMNGLRAEVRDRGIKIINVYPGAVDTPMWHPRIRKASSHRMVQPREIARAVYQATRHSESLMVEEIVLRPQLGDVNV